MKRRLWLQNPETKEIWDLLPDNPYNTKGGCAFLDIAGMGYSQSITQEQVEVDYFISAIATANQDITGTFYFNGDEHLENFQNFIGDFRKQFLLFYSPSAEYEPYDYISSPYYKNVTISKIEKTEKDETGWYLCSGTISTQSDVWKRDVYYEFPDTSDMDEVGTPLVYPYSYEHTLGGRNVYSLDIPNEGREIGCIISITNNSSTPTSQLEWFLDNTYTDYNGIQQTSTQRAKWYTQASDVVLRENYELYVDSNPLTQEAKVNYPDGTSQSVVAYQEPSWDYINFIRIKHGDNRLVIYTDTTDVTISVTFTEQKEII